MLSLFGKIGKAPAPTGGGVHFSDGSYEVEVVKVNSGESSKGEGEYVAIECVIRKVLIQFPNSKKVGETVSNVIMAKHASSASNLKGFLAASMGIDINDPAYSDTHWANMAVKACDGDGTKLKGTILFATATTVPTRKPGGLFTKVLWSDKGPVTEAA